MTNEVKRPEPKKVEDDIEVTLRLTREEWAELWNSIDTKISDVGGMEPEDLEHGEAGVNQKEWWLRTLKSARDRSLEQLNNQGVSV